MAAGFDIVALGDSEKTIVQIVKSVASGAPDFKQVDRIAFLDRGRVVLTGAKPAPATKFIDDVPQPALDALPLEVYRRIGISPSGYPLLGTMFGPLQTSRGCQDACTFCHISLEKEQREEFGNIGLLRMFSNERVSDVLRMPIIFVFVGYIFMMIIFSLIRREYFDFLVSLSAKV